MSRCVRKPRTDAMGFSRTLLALIVGQLALHGCMAGVRIAAMLTGAGATIGLITIQRSAGRGARDATERMRVFSWLGLAPSMANVVGSVSAGLMSDIGGFRAAFALLALLPFVALWVSRRVPR